MAEDLTQLNVHVPDEIIKLIDGDEERDEPGLRARYGWSRRDLVMTAIETLSEVMDAHEKFAEQYAPDQAEVYMRLAAEKPAGFLQVPKEGIKVGRSGDLPVVRVDDWFVFPDRNTGALLAERQGEDGTQIARIVDGEIKPLKLPSAEEVALN
jgi:hypothetical protein